MNRSELDTMLALRNGDHRAVATRVLAQWGERLEGDEEGFLREYADKLDFAQIARWLAFRPERPAPLVELMCERIPAESHVALWHLLRWSEAIEPDVWAHATERLRPRLAPASWKALLYRTRGCGLYDALVRAERALDPPGRDPREATAETVTAALFASRYDERACLEALRSRVRASDERTARVLLDAGRGEEVADEGLRTRALAYGKKEEAKSEPRAEGNGDEFALDSLLDGASLDELLPEPDPVQEKAHREREPLTSERLAWLAQHGASRKELLALTLDALGQREDSEAHEAELLGWVARQLPSRSAWEEHGARVLGFLFDRYRWDMLGRVCTFLERVLEASEGGTSRGESLLLRAGAPPAWTPALHEALNEALCERVREGIAGGSHARAEGVLAALVHLTLPPRAVRVFRGLRAMPGVTERARDLIELHSELCRKGDTSRASLDGVLETVRELCLLDEA